MRNRGVGSEVFSSLSRLYGVDGIVLYASSSTSSTEVWVGRRLRLGRFRVLSDGVLYTADEVGEVATGGGLLWRSDLRVGECSEDTGGLFTADLPLADETDDAELGTAREEACLPLAFDDPFVCVLLAGLRGVLFEGSGGGGGGRGGSLFTRDDFRTPLSKMVVGPSAAKAFHGGEGAREEGRDAKSSSFRRLAGGPAMTPSSTFWTGI
jgi:hypothetical protein